MKYTIKQAKCLKLDLEMIERKEAIRMDKDLIVNLDIKAMYHSITYELVTEAVLTLLHQRIVRGGENESQSWFGNANV